MCEGSPRVRVGVWGMLIARGNGSSSASIIACSDTRQCRRARSGRVQRPVQPRRRSGRSPPTTGAISSTGAAPWLEPREGRWVASDAGLPSEEEFATSENTFKLECSADLATLGSLRVRESMQEEEPPQFVSGSYKLDNGEGLADYSDLEHKLWAADGPPSHHPSTHEWAAVGACGDTEFGRFVSLGASTSPRRAATRG